MFRCFKHGASAIASITVIFLRDDPYTFSVMSVVFPIILLVSLSLSTRNELLFQKK